jgi:calcineurin-like phosphoesterase family protein
MALLFWDQQKGEGVKLGTKAYSIADLHLKHSGVISFRPQFCNSDEHDQFVLDRINSTVGKHDSLYIIGDCCVGDGSYDLLLQLRCENLFLVPGNHDGERTAIQTKYFRKVVGSYARKLQGLELGAVFTHIPVHPACLERWNLNVHGHLHDLTINDPRYFCVSCEQINFTPISMDELAERFAAQLGRK